MKCCVCDATVKTIRKHSSGQSYVNLFALKMQGIDNDCDSGMSLKLSKTKTSWKRFICLDCIILIKRIPFSSTLNDVPF